ncbi:MAG: hypothetical protein WD847_13940 [Pirellulales bacterium]
MTSQPSKHRWARFSLRGLLGLVFLAAACSWWLHVEVERGREREQSVAELAKLGVLTYQYSPNRLGRMARRVSPRFDAWCQDVLGHGAMHDVAAISIYRTLTEEEFQQVLDQFQTFGHLQIVDMDAFHRGYGERIEQSLPHVRVRYSVMFDPIQAR